MLYMLSGIQRLVLAGRMGEAIDTTKQLYPGLLERDADLLFMLKCRQFIEMVNGTDSEVRGPAIRSPKSRHSSGSARSSPSMSPVHNSVSVSVSSSVITTRSTASGSLSGSSGGSSPNRNQPSKSHSSGIVYGGGGGGGNNNNNPGSSSSSTSSTSSSSSTQSGSMLSEADMNAANNAMNGDQTGVPQTNPLTVPQIHMDTSDVDMADTSENGADVDRTVSNGTATNGLCTNGINIQDTECDMGKHKVFSNYCAPS